MKTLFISFIFICTLYSSKTFSQAATSSLFPEMLSINPATVGSRTIGVISVSPKIDSIEKLQDASSAIGGGSSVSITEELDVKSATAFYGGKAGFLTLEAFMETSKGEKTVTIGTGSESNEIKLSGDSRYMRFNTAFMKFFGLGLGFMDFKNSSEFTTRFQNQSYSSSNKGENSIFMIRPGVAFSILSTHLAFYVEKVSNDETSNTDSSEGGTPQKRKTNSTFLGGAVGYASKTFHIEFAYEKQKEDLEITKYGDNGVIEGTEILNPSRATIVLEKKFGKLGLGYTGQYYLDGYINYKDFILNQLAYLNSREEDRLENIFNISWGNEKGHGFSGSFSTSKTTGKEKSLFTNNKQLPTTTKATSASLKYSYSW